MVGSTHFVKSCPTCNRTLQIQIQHLGKRVTCGHCHARFFAFYDDLLGDSVVKSSADDVMQRVDKLLNSFDERVEQV